MTTWILLRHGQSEANAGNWLAGHVDTPLTALGRQQAVEAGRELAAHDLGRIVTSDLARARDTARLVRAAWQEARGRPAPPVEEVPDLRERHTGEWAGRDRAELKAAGLFVHLTSWALGPPGGESQQALARRVVPALARIEAEVEAAADERPVLVVAHGGVIRVTLALLDGVPRDEVGFFGVPNAQAILRHTSAKTFTNIADALLRGLL